MLCCHRDERHLGAGTNVGLPPEASTAFPPPDSESLAGGFLSSASCPSAGNCTTVGSYTKKDQNGGPRGAYPSEFDETGGEFGTGTRPAACRRRGDHDRLPSAWLLRRPVGRRAGLLVDLRLR
jgi:hypothetical protein